MLHIDKIPFDGYVYNFGVNENNNYFANNILVHNCYEGCTPKGLHGSLMKDGKPCWKFIENIHPYTEIALNGNDLTHPDLEDFLRYLKSKKAISNMTVNQ